ncbi:TPA: Hok/Gef family protein [Providencia stuartii]|nr:Hok/Gef family protein [Providencia stuartii]
MTKYALIGLIAVCLTVLCFSLLNWTCRRIFPLTKHLTYI